ncbi:MAG TPA: tetratricopeptide repeat protein [Phenylobacterium sp.]|uniref:O-linked N-acetylglucosamine transferase, SPINDLY family protein n=1 Tax=Phenylobacterium sp. TaxID=1871053 RepID=UPI002B48F4AA|nr:tetratricopeptide repeat protein [Phenylobacterium sp.]HKR87041.1 tetratricopeptide repeat protein [Phenylobacterium sp.]
MSDRLAAAQAALNAGRGAEAIEHLSAALNDDPARPAPVWRALLFQLYQAGRYEEGAGWAAKAAERHPRETEIANLRGVLLRRLNRQDEALAVFEAAARLDPAQTALQVNRCNVLLDLRRGAEAEAGLTLLVRREPRNAELQRQLGRALLMQGRSDPALVRFRQAVAIQKDLIDAWLDLSGALNELHRTKQAEDVLDKALAANPGHPRLVEARAVIYRRAGQARAAETYLRSLLPQFGDAGWLHYQLGVTLSDYDRQGANAHLLRAVELEPKNLDYRIVRIEGLERTRTGDEGANIEEAYQLARALLAEGRPIVDPGARKVLYEVLQRVADFEALAQVGDFKSRGRGWAESGRHAALMKQLSTVGAPGDREELLEQHRIWGRKVEAQAAETAIRRPKPRPRDGRIRLGLMSSDLRRHPVGYFAKPLFETVDERFDLYCYSYYQGAEDDVQAAMAARSKAFRWNPDISARDAAQLIADDQLDMLIELGGSTHMNKLEVMAYRPAVRQASWLGYPHSAGLSTIDYLLVDPYVMPARGELMLEKPLMLPNAWYPLGAFHFRPEPAAAAEPPVARNGYVTFGTANNPQKYSPHVAAAWARVMRETPDSRFLFIRPEGSAPSFRRNLCALFEAGGVAADRILFEPVRGAHLPHYNRIDISLDCFPQTGGTTTCESLWMGAPCVTLVGESLFERLSYSTLMNLGLPELCARTVDEYVEIAAKLAADPARIAELRAGMRARMQASPLGRTEDWARDFYAAVAGVVEGG